MEELYCPVKDIPYLISYRKFGIIRMALLEGTAHKVCSFFLYSGRYTG
jgi:hypothetical protein